MWNLKKSRVQRDIEVEDVELEEEVSVEDTAQDVLQFSVEEYLEEINTTLD